MNINIVKKQPGSWRGQNRRSLALFVRTNARDWDGLFELADDTGTPVKRIVREALREYIARHRQQAHRSEVRITVSGTDGGSGFIGKLVQTIVGSASGREPTERGPSL